MVYRAWNKFHSRNLTKVLQKTLRQQYFNSCRVRCTFIKIKFVSLNYFRIITITILHKIMFVSAFVILIFYSMRNFLLDDYPRYFDNLLKYLSLFWRDICSVTGKVENYIKHKRIFALIGRKRTAKNVYGKNDSLTWSFYTTIIYTRELFQNISNVISISILYKSMNNKAWALLVSKFSD